MASTLDPVRFETSKGDALEFRGIVDGRNRLRMVSACGWHLPFMRHGSGNGN